MMPNVELNGAPLAARPSDRRERFECDVRGRFHAFTAEPGALCSR